MFIDAYGSLCMSTEFMGLWGEYGGLLWINMNMWVPTVSINFNGCLWRLWESMDKYEYTSVNGYRWEFLHVYGSLWGL